MSIYDFCPKHLFFLILCKSHYPHIICVDNVDKFVYNCVSKGFPPFFKCGQFFLSPLCTSTVLDILCAYCQN